MTFKTLNKKLIALILALMMTIPSISMVCVNAADNAYYRAYDITVSPEDGISFKFKMDQTGHNQLVRCDMELKAGNSSTDYNCVFPNKAMPYQNTIQTHLGQADIDIDKTNDIVTITIHPDKINSVTNLDADNPYVWMLIRPCYSMNALDTLSADKGADYYNDVVYLGKYASLQDFKDTKENCAGKVIIDSGIKNGKVSVAKATKYEGEIVELNVVPDDGYIVDKVFADSVEIKPENNKYNFTMPAKDVTVSATFITNPFSATIPIYVVLAQGSDIPEAGTKFVFEISANDESYPLPKETKVTFDAPTGVGKAFAAGYGEDSAQNPWKITFPKEGVYKYTITQIDSEKTGMTVDDGKWEINVIVDKDGAKVVTVASEYHVNVNELSENSFVINKARASTSAKVTTTEKSTTLSIGAGTVQENDCLDTATITTDFDIDFERSFVASGTITMPSTPDGTVVGFAPCTGKITSLNPGGCLGIYAEGNTLTNYSNGIFLEMDTYCNGSTYADVSYSKHFALVTTGTNCLPTVYNNQFTTISSWPNGDVKYEIRFDAATKVLTFVLTDSDSHVYTYTYTDPVTQFGTTKAKMVLGGVVRSGPANCYGLGDAGTATATASVTFNVFEYVDQVEGYEEYKDIFVNIFVCPHINAAYTQNANSLTVNCPLCKRQHTLTLTTPDGYFVKNTKYDKAKLDGKEWADDGYAIPTIYYEGINQTVYAKSATAPVAAGHYKATITAGGKTAESEFVIHAPIATYVEPEGGDPVIIIHYDDKPVTEPLETIPVIIDEGVYDGEPMPGITIDEEPNWGDYALSKPVITYSGKAPTQYGPTDVAPTLPGTYREVLTINGKTVIDKDYVIEKLDGPDAPEGLTAKDATTWDNNNGEINGVDETMEYRKKGDTEWMPVTGNTIPNIFYGDYEVRVKETATTKPGDVTEIFVDFTIKDFNVNLKIKEFCCKCIFYKLAKTLYCNVTGQIPEGYKLVWECDTESADLNTYNEGKNCKVSTDDWVVTKATVTVKLVNINGDTVKDPNGNEIKDSRQVILKGFVFSRIFYYISVLLSYVGC